MDIFFSHTYFSDKNKLASPNLLTFKEVRNRYHGIDSASLCIVAGRYVKKDCRIPARQAGNRFLGSSKGLQIRALYIWGSFRFPWAQMYLNPISVLLLCKYTYLPVLLPHPRFSQCLQNASFSGSIFCCVRRLLQEYKIHTLITGYFLKSFLLGKTFINQKSENKI
jgi:hypothetical protein